jgi:RimJ/RimL family protein N-acetyltransferase
LYFEGYPKTVILQGGQRLDLRPMVREDAEELLNFFKRLSPEDSMFLKHDVTNPKVIQEWADTLDYERVIPILAAIGNRIVGDATLHRRTFGWSPHVGEIRIVTDPEFRRLGIGRHLARELFLLAVRLGLEKVLAEMLEDQHGAIAVFEHLGFEREALFKDHVRDRKGRKHNLIVMSHDINVSWRRIEEEIESSLRDQSGGFAGAK